MVIEGSSSEPVVEEPRRSRPMPKSTQRQEPLIDVNRKVALEMPYRDLMHECMNSPGMEKICNEEAFWQEYNTYQYGITPDMYYDNYSATEITKFINDVLDFHFSIGNLVLFDSLKDMFTDSFKKEYTKDIEKIRKNELMAGNLIEKGEPQLYSLSQAMTVRFNNIKIPFPFSVFKSTKDYPRLHDSSAKGREFFKYLYGLLYKPTLYFSPEGVVEIPFDAFMQTAYFTTTDGKGFMDKNYSKTRNLYDMVMEDVHSAEKSTYYQYAYHYFS
jgi:hypothetical protein